MTKKVWGALIVALVCMMSSAHAQLVIEKKKADSPGKAVDGTPRVAIVGKGDFELSQGMGRSITLGEAISQIVPATWTVNYDLPDGGSQEKKMVVTWRGGTEWPFTLEEVLKQTPSLAATISVTPRSVQIGKVGDVKPVAVATVEAATAPTAETKKAAPEPAPKWILRGGHRVDLELMEWAVRAKWTLLWAMDVTWDVPATTTIEGSFEQAVVKVIESLYADGKSVKVRIYEGNRLMEVVQNVPR